MRYTLIILLAIFFLFGTYDFIDIKEAFAYYGKGISSASPLFGMIIFIICFIFILFTEEILWLFKKSKTKIKFKEKF